MIADSGCALNSYHIEMYIEMVGTNAGGRGGGGCWGQGVQVRGSPRSDPGLSPQNDAMTVLANHRKFSRLFKFLLPNLFLINETPKTRFEAKNNGLFKY